MECGQVEEHNVTPYFHNRRRQPHSWNSLAKNSVGRI